MRVVSYARVSSLAQESEGQSLQNQERAFTRWLERTGNTRVRAYRESASAGTIAGREEFTRMLEELPHLKVDAVIIDVLDRFTRSLRDGLNLLEELRGHGVGLIPIDWHRPEPLDLDKDRDWSDVVDEFTSAEAERRRIRKRIRRAYEGRRERGATLTNNPAFGLRKEGDRLVPDPERAWIIKEIDAKFAAGAKLSELANLIVAMDAKAPHTFSGVRKLFENHSFVQAGVRTPAMQETLTGILDELKSRYGRSVRHVHEFAGVFLCGACYDAGFERRMAATMWRANPTAPLQPHLICAFNRNVGNNSAHPKRSFSVRVFRLEPLWQEIVDWLVSDDEIIEEWANLQQSDEQNPRRKLERRLAKIDQEAAKLKGRRDAAFDLLASKKRALSAQAQRMLQEIEADESAMAAQRAVILGELAHERPVRRDPNALREALALYSRVYVKAPIPERNRMNRELCAIIGSYPRIYREGVPRSRKAPIRVFWPEIGLNLARSGTKTPKVTSSHS